MNSDECLSKATRWFVHLRDGKLSPRGLKALDRWLAVPRNAEVFAEVERLWSEVEQVSLVRSRSVSRQPTRFNLRYFGLAAGLLVLVGAVGVLIFDRWRAGFAGDQVVVFETAVAQHRDVMLVDGSRIQLGAKSSINTNISDELRTVVLNSGEALFQVARDSRRPFRVMAGGGTITAVGTAFNVKRRGDDHVLVTVTEGVVQIAPGNVRLEKGEQIVYDANGRVSRPVAAQNTPPTWHTGELQYRSEPLRNVVPDINRYSQRQLVLRDEAAGELPFTGTVLEQHVDEWIDRLERIYPELEVTFTDAGQVLIGSSPATKKD